MEVLNQYRNPQVEDLPNFMSALEKVRAQMQYNQWCDYAQNSPLIKKWRYLLASDPYTRWGFVKPRGYPGDATLMDFAYGHPSVAREIELAGPVGGLIYKQTSGAAQSESARQRISLIASEIRAQIKIRGDIKITSLASGHARELEALNSKQRSRIKRFIAIDADPQSLEEVKVSAKDIPVTLIRKNLIRAKLFNLPNTQLVYSLGLFDYLEPHHADLVLSKMWGKTLSGGVLIIANLAPDAANLGYCEAIMDWWMIPRSEKDMENLADTIDSKFGDIGNVSVSRCGCFIYLRMEKSY